MPVGFCLFAFVLFAQIAAAGRAAARRERAAAEIQINGAGSTTASLLVRASINEYSRAHPRVQISYWAIGSRAGVRSLATGEKLFAVTDAPISDAELALAKGRILALPIALNAIVPIYNLAHIPEVRFSSATLADIFLGKITRWNDPAIASDNAGLDLPRTDIKVAHRFPNESVDTEIMADYLSKISSDFKATLASSSGANWPVANAMAGFKGQEGMHQFVSGTPASIGYLPLIIARLELAHGDQGKFEYGAVRNSAGEFVTASPESVTAASAAEVPFLEAQPPDFRVSITNAPGKSSYPIASFIWLNFYENSTEDKTSEALADFLKWILADGQRLASKLGYPPLPANLIKLELRRLEVGHITAN